MNNMTLCDDCIHNKVCSYKIEYASTVRAYKDFMSPKPTFEVSIKCKEFYNVILSRSK